MTDLEREWKRLQQLVSATKGLESISESCVCLQHVAAEFKARGKGYQIMFGGKPGPDLNVDDPPSSTRWDLEPRPRGNQFVWFVDALRRTLTTEELALEISAKLTKYSREYENEISL